MVGRNQPNFCPASHLDAGLFFGCNPKPLCEPIVGASLLAMAVGQVALMLKVPASSRASSLPQSSSPLLQGLTQAPT
ncbi:hypothetical protein C1C98_14745 [Pseudomonas ogarae]|uniref:Uncharacterized protein n=1 Tax=Pseudomonas ogarae (strain DSM 112162 / CECT 30235 / F113) TaxID=1114970 RepID=A0ABN5G5L3_PSEO1|nr:hypothetical protein C1C98_14745 [Pseudomonas ogarae]